MKKQSTKRVRELDDRQLKATAGGNGWSTDFVPPTSGPAIPQPTQLPNSWQDMWTPTPPVPSGGGGGGGGTMSVKLLA